MSISEIAAALIGLRETTYKDHQRFSNTIDRMQAAVEGMQTALDESLDRRLAQSAQAVRDVDRRMETEYERRIDAMLMTLIVEFNQDTSFRKHSTCSLDFRIFILQYFRQGLWGNCNFIDPGWIVQLHSNAI